MKTPTFNQTKMELKRSYPAKGDSMISEQSHKDRLSFCSLICCDFNFFKIIF